MGSSNGNGNGSSHKPKNLGKMKAALRQIVLRIWPEPAAGVGAAQTGLAGVELSSRWQPGELCIRSAGVFRHAGDVRRADRVLEETLLDHHA